MQRPKPEIEPPSPAEPDIIPEKGAPEIAPQKSPQIEPEEPPGVNPPPGSPEISPPEQTPLGGKATGTISMRSV